MGSIWGATWGLLESLTCQSRLGGKCRDARVSPLQGGCWPIFSDQSPLGPPTAVPASCLHPGLSGLLFGGPSGPEHPFLPTSTVPGGTPSRPAHFIRVPVSKLLSFSILRQLRGVQGHQVP